MLIEAFYKAFKDKKDIKLLIVGDGEEQNNLQNLIKRLNLNSQIKLYGKANRKEVANLLAKSDAFVLSSYQETFGVVLIEALASGLPIVATKSGGVESIVTSKKIGYLSDINADDLANALQNLYNNYNSFDKEFLREYAIKNFSKEVVVKKLKNIYIKATDEKNDFSLSKSI